MTTETDTEPTLPPLEHYDGPTPGEKHWQHDQEIDALERQHRKRQCSGEIFAGIAQTI